MKSAKGRFITLEGGEGAGKSTLLQGLRGYLEAAGVPLVLAREPGGTPLGEAIRALVLDAALGKISAEAELLLMFSARAQLVREIITPALAAGQWVLCDRFVDASYAYQGSGRGQPSARIADLESWTCAGLIPDVTLWLDLPVATGRNRISERGPADRIEAETQAFFERVRIGYQQRAALDPRRFRLLDAGLPPEQVLAAAQAALAPLLSEAMA